MKVIDVLYKLAGLWINTNKLILYSQATHIRYIVWICCIFLVGSPVMFDVWSNLSLFPPNGKLLDKTTYFQLYLPNEL